MKLQIDTHKLAYHPERINEWKSKGDCAPIYVEIGPTNRCNHKCIFCALDYLEHGNSDIPSETMVRNLENMAKFGVKSIMFAGEGEPLLHKNISDFVRVAKRNGIDVSVTSNGVLFNQKKAEEILPYLSWIRFSIDAGTSETYSEVHGTRKIDFEKVLKNIEYASELKRKNNYDVTIGTQLLLINKNIRELDILARELKEIGVENLQIKPYSRHPSSQNDLSFDYKEAEKIIPEIEKMSSPNFQIIYRAKTIERLFSPREYKECLGLPFFALIDARGNVIPYNMFYGNEKFTYGNIKENLFSEIWTGEKRKQVVKGINNQGINKCRIGCRLDVINRYLEKVKQNDKEIKMPEGESPMHVNFI